MLGRTFDIDPNFFRRHFYYRFIYTEDLYDNTVADSIEKEVSLLPSETYQTTFELGFTRNYDKMSVLLYKDPVSKQTTGMANSFHV